MLFVTILVDLTLARANLDTQEMAKIALVSYICLTRTKKILRNEMIPHENQAIRPQYGTKFFLVLIFAIFKLHFFHNSQTKFYSIVEIIQTSLTCRILLMPFI